MLGYGFAVLIAVAVPTIGPFIGLIGAFCFSLLGIVVPLIIEFATYWDEVTVWMAARNVVLIAVGVLALVFGTANSIADIVRSCSGGRVRHQLHTDSANYGVTGNPVTSLTIQPHRNLQ